MEVLGALTVLVGLVVVILLAFRGYGVIRTSTVTGFATGSRGLFVAFLVGVVVALAYVQVAVDNAGISSSWTVFGLALGLLATLLTLPGGIGTVVEWGFGVLGAIASVPALAQLVAGPSCPGAQVVPTWVRLATAALLVAFAALGAAFAFGFGKLRPLTPLAWFGAVEVLAFLEAPGGLDLLAHDAPQMVVVLVAAGGLGFLTAWSQELVLAAAGASIVLGQMALVGAGLGCGTTAGAGAGALAALLVPYCIGFAGLGVLLRGARSRRRR